MDRDGSVDRGKQNNERRYTSDDVARVVRAGLQEKSVETVSHQDLIDIGDEFGLSESEIGSAVEKLDAEKRPDRGALVVSVAPPGMGNRPPVSLPRRHKDVERVAILRPLVGVIR